jgi:hypothetical protein
MRVFLFISLMFLRDSSLGNCHEIKLVDGVDKKGERGPNNGLVFHEPSLLSGPESLFFLNGLCFLATQDRYEYSVCPFQNITQRWVTNETHHAYDTMSYLNGQTCGRKGRSAQLGLSCGHSTFEVLTKSITEVSFQVRWYLLTSAL